MLIVIAECHGRTIQFPLTEGLQEINVGSRPENHIYVPYKGVSRLHFSLFRERQEWVLKDLGSTNGTLVNGSRITEKTIHPGDVISAGIVEFTVTERDDSDLVFIPPKALPIADTEKTDKVDSAILLDEGVFDSARLVFPEGMVPGKSASMAEIYRRLDSIADSDVNILLIGETGTGKEMIARILQLSGKHAKGPFIAVNCSAIPSDLAEAELFGIGEKVATDVSRRKGKIAMADRGTLFLDELSTFPMGLQAKILRAIEEKSVTPIGEHQPNPANFRLICATNEDPKDLIQNGRLREDLYHRIATVEIFIPPLRERKEDLPVLILGLLRDLAAREKKPLFAMSKKLFSLLMEYSYPGNVRELANLLRSMLALSHPGEILDTHVAPGKLLEGKHELTGAEKSESEKTAADSMDLRATLDDVTRKWICRALNLHKGNITAAAKSLKLSPFGLRKMMKRLEISSGKREKQEEAGPKDLVE